MNFNLVTDIQACHAIRDSLSMGPIYYSHIPTAILAVLVGLFVFWKSGKTLLGKILLAIGVVFSFWSSLDLIIWEYGYNSVATMFSWSLLGLLSSMIFILSLYFVYVFIDGGDISRTKTMVFFGLLLPVAVFTPTVFNLGAFDAINCNTVEGKFFTNYYYLLGGGVFLWILGLFLFRYRKIKPESRYQATLLVIGIEFFLLSFFTAGYLSSLTDNYSVEFYGLFGMVVFMAFLGYLIVQYHLFNIRLLAVQALVATLAFLIAAQLFFVKTTVNFVLTQVTLVLVLITGYVLIQSVKKEIERKEELQHLAEQLTVANDHLRVLDTAKSEFISIASHQLRTPLTSIKGFVSLILEGSYGHVPHRIEDALNKIYASNERLIRLVEDLLNLSRIESGRMEYRIEPSHIEDALKELEDSFQITARQKGLKLDLHLPEAPLPLVSVDFFKFREVVSNLIDNALKYTPSGSIDISVIVNASGKSVRVSVTDTGIGIPASEIDSLFQKFSRGKDTSRLHANGTGLGLYLGKELIEAMHGRIWFESPGEGKGSTFLIELPVA